MRFFGLNIAGRLARLLGINLGGGPAAAQAAFVEAQREAARHMRWLISEVSISDAFVFSGWALDFDDPADVKFLLNGQTVGEVRWPRPSPDVAAVYPDIPVAGQARFKCVQMLPQGTDPFAGGFARLSFFNRRRASSELSDWFVPDPRGPDPLPDQARISRVIGAPSEINFLLGGATVVNRFDIYLRQQCGRELRSYSKILDWGCGAGRITRDLLRFSQNVVGADIDGDNIAWCRDNLSGGEFVRIGLDPPTPFAPGSFDLVLGVSVVTHLAEDQQFRWFEELQRITMPGAILLLSMEGPAQFCFHRVPPLVMLRAQREGLIVTGQNPQLDGVIEDKTYYKDVIHSRDYVRSRWAKYFDVLDIVSALACHQDVVVLRRR